MGWELTLVPILAVELCLGTALAESARPPPPVTLVLWLSDEVGLSDSEFGVFGDEVARLFMAVGIISVSVHCRVDDSDLDPAACRAVLRDNEFLVKIVPGASKERVGAMGVSRVRTKGASVHATLYFEQIKDVADVCGRRTGSVMALVLVHEIGHLLGGPAHYPLGVMQTNWTSRQIIELLGRGPLFDGTHAKQLRDNLARRNVGVTAQAVK